MKRGDTVVVAYQTHPDLWTVTGRIGEDITVTRICDGVQSVFAVYDLHLVKEKAT